MSVLRLSLARGDTHALEAGTHHALWQQSGIADVGGTTVPVGEGYYSDSGVVTAQEDSAILIFSISSSGAAPSTILTAGFDWAGEAVLRLDQVSFPPGARAYRHVHPGPGIRYLTEGELEIRSDHSTDVMTSGDAWFEGANSPVQATAGTMHTAFVRAVVLPPEYFGKPTLRLLDPEDANKPRLQTNRRFFDQKLTLRGG